MHYIIDRKTWLRGTIGTNIFSSLFDSETGKMCCIGQVSIQCGFAEEDILDVADINDLFCIPRYREKVTKLFSGLDFLTNTPATEYSRIEQQWVKECYTINDNNELSDDQREALLKVKFESAGHTLEFVN